jgi:threonine/homoserine/homoserine lactone efflux protein
MKGGEMDSTLPSLLGFAVSMYITPGPNNVMVASSAATYGIRATTPHMLGIAAGFAFMVLLVSAGLAGMLTALPWLIPVMRWGGAAWMLYIAWKIATAGHPQAAGRRNLLGFAGAAGFQWINPKGWMIAVAAGSEFIRPDHPVAQQLLRIGIVFSLLGLPCLMVWALIGSGAGRILNSPARLRAFNVAMALLLVASLVPLLIEN